MLFDTNFLIDLEEELATSRVGPARGFLGRYRDKPHAVSVISLGEIAAGMPDNTRARLFLSRFRVLSLKPEIALAAAGIDRALIAVGGRLGENDTWIAGFAIYYGLRLVTNDAAFRRVAGIRVLQY